MIEYFEISKAKAFSPDIERMLKLLYEVRNQPKPDIDKQMRSEITSYGVTYNQAILDACDLLINNSTYDRANADFTREAVKQIKELKK